MSFQRMTSLERFHHPSGSFTESERRRTESIGEPTAVYEPPQGSFFDLSARLKFTILAIAVADFFSGASYSLIAPFFPDEGIAKGATKTEVGFIIGSFQLVGFILSPFLGKYMAILGCKFVFITGIFVGGCSSFLFGLLNLVPDGTPFVAWCFVVRSFQAAGMHAFTTASYAIIANEFPAQLSTIFGILETFFGVGMMCGPPIGGALYQLGGFTLPFAVVGVCLLIAAVVNYCMLPSGIDAQSSGSQNFIRMLIIPSVLIATSNVVGGALSLGFLEATLALYLDMFGLSFTTIGFIFLVPSALYAGLAPAFGWVGDTKGRCKVLMAVATLFNLLAFAFIGPSPIFNIDGQQLWVVIICLVMQGLSLGGQLVPAMLDMLTAAKWNGYPDDFETYGLVAGLFHSSVALGAFTGPSIGGAMYDAIGFPWAATVIAGYQLLVLSWTVLYIVTHIKAEIFNIPPDWAITDDVTADEKKALLEKSDGSILADGEVELTKSGELLFHSDKVVF